MWKEDSGPGHGQTRPATSVSPQRSLLTISSSSAARATTLEHREKVHLREDTSSRHTVRLLLLHSLVLHISRPLQRRLILHMPLSLLHAQPRLLSTSWAETAQTIFRSNLAYYGQV